MLKPQFYYRNLTSQCVHWQIFDWSMYTLTSSCPYTYLWKFSEFNSRHKNSPRKAPNVLSNRSRRRTLSLKQPRSLTNSLPGRRQILDPHINLQHSLVNHDSFPSRMSHTRITHDSYDSRADCSHADMPGKKAEHGGLTKFGKVRNLFLLFSFKRRSVTSEASRAFYATGLINVNEIRILNTHYITPRRREKVLKVNSLLRRKIKT